MKGKDIFIRPLAESDIEEIWLYIAADNTSAADRVVGRIGEALDMLVAMPGSGRARPELQDRIRSFPVGSSVIFYMPRDDGIDVIRVLSSYRDISDEDFLGTPLT